MEHNEDGESEDLHHHDEFSEIVDEILVQLEFFHDSSAGDKWYIARPHAETEPNRAKKLLELSDCLYKVVRVMFMVEWHSPHEVIFGLEDYETMTAIDPSPNLSLIHI